MSSFCRDEYELLEAVEARLVVHPLTAPILGNDHNEFRGRESRVREVDISYHGTLFKKYHCRLHIHMTWVLYYIAKIEIILKAFRTNHLIKPISKRRCWEHLMPCAFIMESHIVKTWAISWIEDVKIVSCILSSIVSYDTLQVLNNITNLLRMNHGHPDPTFLDQDIKTLV